MNLLRPWRWLRAAVLELTGVAACLLLIGFSHTERTLQPNGPTPVSRDTRQQSRHNGEDTQPPDEELWQIPGVALEKALE
jgi:hypothetical protein